MIKKMAFTHQKVIFMREICAKLPNLFKLATTISGKDIKIMIRVCFIKLFYSPAIDDKYDFFKPKDLVRHLSI